MSGTTGMILFTPEVPHLTAIIEAIERVRAETYTAMAIPPGLLRFEDLPTAQRILRDMGAAMPRLIGGMNVVVSKILSEMPARAHKKRRWMSDAYHRRIQKKWNKRFGVGPVAVFMDMEKILMPPIDGATP